MQDALSIGVKALARREHTVAELEALLRRKGVGEADAQQAIAELAETGAVDDERFARQFAADKRELAGWGELRIREALGQRGIPAADIDAALIGDGDESELERAVGALEGRFTALESEAERGRALSFLVRRGFELELAYDAIRSFERR